MDGGGHIQDSLLNSSLPKLLPPESNPYISQERLRALQAIPLLQVPQAPSLKSTLTTSQTKRKASSDDLAEFCAILENSTTPPKRSRPLPKLPVRDDHASMEENAYTTVLEEDIDMSDEDLPSLEDDDDEMIMSQDGDDVDNWSDDWFLEEEGGKKGEVQYLSMLPERLRDKIEDPERPPPQWLMESLAVPKYQDDTAQGSFLHVGNLSDRKRSKMSEGQARA